MDACAIFLGFLLVINVGGYFLARHDKHQATRRRDRIPERTFHLLALLGAGVGILVAFGAHRHKTRKTRFFVPFVAATLAGGVLVGAWLALLGC